MSDETFRGTPALTVLAEDRHAWFAGRTRAILKYLDAELGPAQAGQRRRILDIGAGAGNMAHHLAHYGQVIGLDYVSRPLTVAVTLDGTGTALLPIRDMVVPKPCCFPAYRGPQIRRCCRGSLRRRSARAPSSPT